MLMDLFPLLYVQDGCIKYHAFFTLPVTLFFFFLFLLDLGLAAWVFTLEKKKKGKQEERERGKEEKKKGEFHNAKIAKIIEDGSSSFKPRRE